MPSFHIMSLTRRKAMIFPISDRLLGLSDYSFVYHDDWPGENYCRETVTRHPSVDTPDISALIPSSLVTAEPSISEDYTRRLPFEILGMIFLYFSESGTYTDSRNAKPPFILGHICGRWRNLALSTPMLWCNIAGPRSNSMLLLYRSSTCPLSLKWHVTRDDDTIKRTWDMFFSVSSRWRQLDILVDPASVDSLLFIHSPNFPLLETLIIRIEKYAVFGKVDGVDFQSSPRLRDLAIKGAADNLFLRSAFPLSQIENLRMDGRSLGPMSQYLHMLSQLPRLRGLMVQNTPWLRSLPAAVHNLKCVVLPMLEDLIVEDVLYWKFLFYSLTLPQLRNIHIYSHRYETQWPEQIVSPFLSRSSLSLEAPIQSLFCSSMSCTDPNRAFVTKGAFVGRFVSSPP
jgi:hypothetical protein